MRKIILVVEDYDDSRELIKFMLETLGHEVLEATNGSEAIEFARSEHPDLILMDIAMPVMDGITATRKIRMLSEDNLSHVPIICLTAHINSYLQEALDAGCNEVVGKPINLTVLQPLVQQYLSVLMILMINILCGCLVFA